ncbi:MAG TPA: helix-turn-helix domain-containing protein [Gemmatimonadales bacterium]|nr:helix-turn-helix domain-containing protein [Gemmatimonadales bacterium]
MSVLDLTPFGFTPTESRVYEVLLAGGPGTGYAVARSAGLARANAYSALEGLVTKGAARTENGQPRRFRAESPGSVLARIANAQGEAFERLSRALDGLGSPQSPSVVELTSSRGALQLLVGEIGRAAVSVHLIAPAEGYPLMAVALRRAVSAGLEVQLFAQAQVQLAFARVEAIPGGFDWPGLPLVAVVDGRSAVVAARQGADVRGHWSSDQAFVRAAQITFDRLRTVLLQTR